MFKMQPSPRYDSIVARERTILGKVSFLPPVVPKNGAVTVSFSGRENPPKGRREQTFKAQRNHRKRTKDYMDALEEEILRLRTEKDRLNEVAANWKRCAVALLGAEQTVYESIQSTLNFEPGVFIWMVPSPSENVAPDMGRQQQQITEPQSQQLLSINSYAEHLSLLGFHSKSAFALLQNFCKNIVPTLRLAETYSGGYMKYYLPLALNSKMVMSSLLTVSASHMQLLQLRNIAVHRYIYRSITFTELQQASSEQDPNHVLPLLALASILGLLIEDIIAGTAEFPALLRMTQFWICRDHFHNYGPQEKTTLRFLLDQIQLMRSLVYPMYKIDPSPDLSKSRRSAYQSPLINNAAKLYRIFFSIESAMAHACRIYKLSVILRRENGRRSMELSIDINSLLDDLALTVRDIPPFAFGESSLVWGYFVAASNSILPDHRAFYNSRLAKLLHRIGHGNIKSIMAAANAI